ncbi:hypothetical protein F5Y16DRAFT_425128 [Xylariaceae sp. FL0255]|nr:hypothetical protein F5Y16DRAFT_425128 [Xylariaceae sp. FL0255]
MALTRTTLLVTMAGQTVLSKPTPRSPSTLLLVRTVFQLQEVGTWFESIAQRSNGDILVTLLEPNASIYSIERPLSDSPKGSVIASIPNANGTGGIAEMRPDVFVVGAGSYYPSILSPVAGSQGLWELDLTGKHPITRLITKIADAKFLNGIEPLAGALSNIVLVADSYLGLVWRVDANTGTYTVGAQFPEMAPVSTAEIQLGVNGIKVRDHYLYWTNSDLHSIYRVALNCTGFAASDAVVERVASFNTTNHFVDDFAISANGDFWVATNGDDDVQVAKVNGTGVIVAGSVTSLELGGDTDLIFGRTEQDKHMVYVTNSGAQAVPVNGSLTAPASVAVIDAFGFSL